MNDNEIRDRDSTKNTICRLEWIAMAIDAARRYKEAEQPLRDERRTAPRVAEESA